MVACLQNSRIFTVYFSQLINHPGVFGPHYSGSITVDYIAFILVLIMTAVSVFPVKATRVGFKCQSNPQPMFTQYNANLYVYTNPCICNLYANN